MPACPAPPFFPTGWEGKHFIGPASHLCGSMPEFDFGIRPIWFDSLWFIIILTCFTALLHGLALMGAKACIVLELCHFLLVLKDDSILLQLGLLLWPSFIWWLTLFLPAEIWEHVQHFMFAQFWLYFQMRLEAGFRVCVRPACLMPRQTLFRQHFQITGRNAPFDLFFFTEEDFSSSWSSICSSIFCFLLLRDCLCQPTLMSSSI